MQYGNDVFFTLAGAAFRLNTSIPLEITAELREFCIPRPGRTDEWIRVSAVPRLPAPAAGGVRFDMRLFEYHPDGERVFHDRGPGTEPDAMVRYGTGGQIRLGLRNGFPGTGLPSHLLVNLLCLERVLLELDALLLHASFIRFRGRGILFSAPSGTGKSTQAALWAAHRGAEILNGDRAAIRCTDGQWRSYGLPLAGPPPGSTGMNRHPSKQSWCWAGRRRTGSGPFPRQRLSGRCSRNSLSIAGTAHSSNGSWISARRWCRRCRCTCWSVLRSRVQWSCCTGPFRREDYDEHQTDPAPPDGAYPHPGRLGRDPLSGTFELTPCCNMACKMCYVRKTKQEQEAIAPLRTAEEWICLGRTARDAGMLYLLLTAGSSALVQEYHGTAYAPDSYRSCSISAAVVDGFELSRELVADWKNGLLERGYAVRSVNSMLASVNSLLQMLGWGSAG